MSLTNRLKTGDDLLASAVNQNFTDLATLANSVKIAYVRPGSVHQRHTTGDYSTKAKQSRVGTIGTSSSWARVVPNTNVSWTTFSGQAVRVVATADIESFSSGNDCALELQLRVDLSSPGTMVTVGHVKKWAMKHNERRHAVTSWIFQASAASHRIELWAQDATGFSRFANTGNTTSLKIHVEAFGR